MKKYILLTFLLISSMVYSQVNQKKPFFDPEADKRYRDSLQQIVNELWKPREDSSYLAHAKQIWANEQYSYNSYKPWIREENVNSYLEKILPESPYYQDRLVLEDEIKSYFEMCQPIVDERYDYYVKTFAGVRNYRSLLRKLVDYGFTQDSFFAKQGNMFYNYSLIEFSGLIKVEVQIKINYANDISYEVYTYCY